MEINVTKIVNEVREDKFCFSASASEIGQGAGQYTWTNAIDFVEDGEFILSPNELEEWKDYVPSFGAWDSDETSQWSDEYYTALFIQFVAGNYREDYDNEMEKSSEDMSGRIYQCDVEGHDEQGDWFYYVGI